MDTWPETSEIAVRLVWAVVFGGLLGFEREWQGKHAGLRTHMMVCLGSATVTLIGFEIYVSSTQGSAETTTRLDPLRILEAVVGGLGFMCAGAILQRGSALRGLTTAGSLWLTGAIGIAIGGGQYVIATLATLLGLVTLFVIGRMERRFLDGRTARHDDDEDGGDDESQRTGGGAR